VNFALQQQSSGLSPAIVAALIAVPVGLLTLVVQWLGIRRVSNDTNKQLEDQGKQLDRTLAEQRDRLDRTLAEQRDRTLNERFAAAADRLGADKPAAVRLAAVYAMAGLADDWQDARQTCVEVLCAYLRMPYSQRPDDDAAEADRRAFQENREVRHTAIRVIGAHLRPDAKVSWQGLNLDFSGVVFDGGDFNGAVFAGGLADFRRAVFSGWETDFGGAVFAGGKVDFGEAVFSGGEVSFVHARFGSDCCVSFEDAQFGGAEVRFVGAQFSEGEVSFIGAQVSDGEVSFESAQFCGALVRFDQTQFSAGIVKFGSAKFLLGTATFIGTDFTGSKVSFVRAQFSGSKADFSEVRTWSVPPVFDFAGSPPDGVVLPPAVVGDLATD
jgi:uncharacterized protein YjbI with pentapeptide repeats